MYSNYGTNVTLCVLLQEGQLCSHPWDCLFLLRLFVLVRVSREVYACLSKSLVIWSPAGKYSGPLFALDPLSIQQNALGFWLGTLQEMNNFQCLPSPQKTLKPWLSASAIERDAHPDQSPSSCGFSTCLQNKCKARISSSEFANTCRHVLSPESSPLLQRPYDFDFEWLAEDLQCWRTSGQGRKHSYLIERILKEQLQYRSQASGTAIAFAGGHCHFLQGIGGRPEVCVGCSEQLLVLFAECIAWLSQHLLHFFHWEHLQRMVDPKIISWLLLQHHQPLQFMIWTEYIRATYADLLSGRPDQHLIEPRWNCAWAW